ncbi:MAG: hypothetical protein Q8934_06745 [Bacillota bacterium]|nr:hypothetical protein [Bacillota bacterium]
MELQNQSIYENGITVVSTESKQNKGLTYVVLGWMFVAVSFIFMPLLFGTVAFCMSIMTYLDRSRAHGIILMVFSFTGLVLGSLLSLFVTGTMFI